MSDLSPRARGLIELGRLGDEPDSAARDRVRARVMMAVGTGLAASTAAKSATAAGKLWAGAAMLKIAGGVCAVGIAVGGATWVASTREPPAQQQSQVAAVVHEPVAIIEVPVASIPVVSAPEAQTAAPRSVRSAVPTRANAPPAETSVPPQPEPAPVAASLEGELSLLREAQTALSRGDARRGLDLLQEHESRYPNGLMSQEREAARVVALCKAGRREEARAAAERFVEQHPDSPMTARVRAACAR